MTSFFQSRLVRDLIVPLLIGLLWALIILASAHPVQFVELKAYDAMLLLKARCSPGASVDKIVIIAIDDPPERRIASVNTNVPLFFWTPRLARIISMLDRAGARVVGLDYNITVDTSEYLEEVIPRNSVSKPKGAAGDQSLLALLLSQEQMLATALSCGKVVLIANPGRDGWVKPLPAYVASAGEGNLSLSSCNYDVDGVIRQQLLYNTDIRKESLLGFPLLLASKFLQQPVSFNENGRVLLGERSIPGDDPQSYFINYNGPPGTFKPISAYDVLGMLNDDRMCRELFGDRLVLIGITYSGAQDFHSTPFNSLGSARQMAGVEILANAVNTLIQGDFISRASPPAQKCLLLIVCAALSLLLYRISLAKGLLITALACVTTFFICTYVLIHYHLWVNTASFMLSEALVCAAIFPYRYLVVSREQRHTKKILERYVSKTVAEQLLKSPEKLRLGGEMREVTVLFSDINDFTTLSEKTKPEELVAALNDYFTLMEEIIFKNMGTLEKFVGDEIMVLFGAPLHEAEHQKLAVFTALDMIEELDKWNTLRRSQGKIHFLIKIGIHTGKVVLGNVGSPNRTQYTAIGDSVNLAARIMGLTKPLDTTILVSEDTYNGCRDYVEVKDMGLHSVKGRQQQVRVYTPLGKKG